MFSDQTIVKNVAAAPTGKCSFLEEEKYSGLGICWVLEVEGHSGHLMMNNLSGLCCQQMYIEGCERDREGNTFAEN